MNKEINDFIAFMKNKYDKDFIILDKNNLVIINKTNNESLIMIDNIILDKDYSGFNKKNKSNHWYCDICQKDLYMKDKKTHYLSAKHKKNEKNRL